jgi:hypothetical protein
MVFTPELFKYVLTQMIPEIIVHSQSQDEEQVRDHYDSMHPYLLNILANILTSVLSGGDDFYEWSVLSLSHGRCINIY